MRVWLLPVLFGLSSQAFAEACVVHSQGDQVDVKICQQNVNIPKQMFHDGFCQPQLKGQKVDVSYAEQCPAGSFGVCRNARVGSTPYQQDIHYYGVASDAHYLKPFCEKQSKGKWMDR
ncbi:NADH:ubiquinone oxidoreductase [Pseudomonas sp. RIT-PI-AD]|uniref:NADH:ubiquinone oxidoreductase n=1 Tax=Pseudomonas sp. RIT-PI-AD TaxID=3035294 RepID=UPI0021D96F31|nr:NADH:ubiquinone oxidoreductase [Pseudomonas sp. RIT-PI-AD]